MYKKIKILCVGLALTVNAFAANAEKVDVTIHFNNETNQKIVQTQEPYLDKFNYALPSDYGFTAPQKSIDPHQSSNVTIFYPRAWEWYGMSQYTYNYEGRSPEYGCIITEIRLSRAWARWSPFYNHRILITSYRQDPEHLDNYLMCDADNLDNTSFTVHFKSVQASTDSNTDDSKRYLIKDTNGFLADVDKYFIDLPIPLWVDQKQVKAFVIRPNKSTPEIVGLDYLAKMHPAPENTKIITVMNHAAETLVARPPLLDKFSKLRHQYYIDQPDEIKPGETKQIKVALSNEVDNYSYLSAVRFNYYIQGHSAEKPSGCYITFAPAPII